MGPPAYPAGLSQRVQAGGMGQHSAAELVIPHRAAAETSHGASRLDGEHAKCAVGGRIQAPAEVRRREWRRLGSQHLHLGRIQVGSVGRSSTQQLGVTERRGGVNDCNNFQGGRVSARAAWWEEGFRRLEGYVKKNGHASPPQSYAGCRRLSPGKLGRQPATDNNAKGTLDPELRAELAEPTSVELDS